MQNFLKSHPRFRRRARKHFERVARQLNLSVGNRVVDLHEGLTREFSLNDALAGFLAGVGPGAFFVQIGANNGVDNDPLRDAVRRLSVGGLLVEPQQDAFHRLEESYEGVPNLRFERAAIGRFDGVQNFYRVNEAVLRSEGLPLRRNFSTVSSLDRDTVAAYLVDWTGKKSIAQDPARYISEEKVPTLTFESLLKKHGVAKFDLLVVDAEGFDNEIIKMVDFDRHCPGMILWEHHLLSEAEKVECWKYLKSLGYDCVVTYKDTLAIKTHLS